MVVYRHEARISERLNPRLFTLLQTEMLRTQLPLLPNGINAGRLNKVLDVGCGLHQWGKDLYHMLVKQVGQELVESVAIDGLDRNSALLSQAQSELRMCRNNVHLYSADMFYLPEMLYQRYDLVQVRFLSPYVTPTAWPELLKQLRRAVKPGGWLVWIEPDLPMPLQDVPVWNQWLSWIGQAIETLGGSPGISAQMDTLFHNAGHWECIERSVTNIPLGFPSRIQGRVPAEVMSVLKERLIDLHSLLQATGVAPSKQANKTFTDMLDTFAWRRLQSTWTWHTIYGTKSLPFQARLVDA